MKILNTNKKEQVISTMRKGLKNFIGQSEDQNWDGLFLSKVLVSPIEHLEITRIKCPTIKIYNLQYYYPESIEEDLQNFVENSDNWNFMTLGPPISNKD